jgi:ATP-binding cassette subfamily B protein
MAGVLTPHVKVLMKLVLTYQDVRPSLHRVLEFQAVKSYLIKEVDVKPYPVETGKIEFEKVAFAYSENKILMLPLSFVISPNKITAITGVSGSGKSTLAKLMIRLLSPKEGAILIDGQNIKTMTLKSLRENIHLTLQNNYIFDGTILENLTYRVKNKDKKEVLKAIKRSGIDFINELPNGLNTVVGENGLNISGGEAQKISFARALLKKPKVYIFDEITSSLDAESESIILKTISQLKQEATVIMICHKSSTLEIADEIISIEDGLLKHVVMEKEVMVN